MKNSTNKLALKKVLNLIMNSQFESKDFRFSPTSFCSQRLEIL